MVNVLISVKITDSGHVEVARKIDGEIWRRAISPHDEVELDEYAPELAPDDRQSILDAWSVIPVPVPGPVTPQPTDGQIYDSVIKNQAVLKALVLALNAGSIVPGANVSNAQLKTAIKAKM